MCLHLFLAMYQLRLNLSWFPHFPFWSQSSPGWDPFVLGAQSHMTHCASWVLMPFAPQWLERSEKGKWNRTVFSSPFSLFIAMDGFQLKWGHGLLRWLWSLWGRVSESLVCMWNAHGCFVELGLPSIFSSGSGFESGEQRRSWKWMFSVWDQRSLPLASPFLSRFTGQKCVKTVEENIDEFLVVFLETLIVYIRLD